MGGWGKGGGGRRWGGGVEKKEEMMRDGIGGGLFLERGFLFFLKVWVFLGLKNPQKSSKGGPGAGGVVTRGLGSVPWRPGERGPWAPTPGVNPVCPRGAPPFGCGGLGVFPKNFPVWAPRISWPLGAQKVLPFGPEPGRN